MNWEDVFKRIITGEIQDIGTYNWNQAQSYNAAYGSGVQGFGRAEKWDPNDFTKK